MQIAIQGHPACASDLKPRLPLQLLLVKRTPKTTSHSSNVATLKVGVFSAGNHGPLSFFLPAAPKKALLPPPLRTSRQVPQHKIADIFTHDPAYFGTAEPFLQQRIC